MPFDATPLEAPKYDADHLPEKLSELIFQSVEDIRKVQQAGITLNMDEYINYLEQGQICSVCLGGAFLVGTCSVDDFRKARYSAIQMANALDYVRCGDARNALQMFYGYECKPPFKAYRFAYYGVVRGKKIEAMIRDVTRMARDLQAAGY